ncbi:serpin B4-like isoform X2 [Microplitis mediator]|uniref:serpin B4-like isoform X2 n=1 Tax=Microplitis mediator TaxID=375433 RepID=UPI002552A10D|nr:serpin B4-like isoform X2 [Microplitis mediator]
MKLSSFLIILIFSIILSLKSEPEACVSKNSIWDWIINRNNKITTTSPLVIKTTATPVANNKTTPASTKIIEDDEMQAILDISTSINQFSFELHEVIANNTNGSFISSPLSAAMILMMAAYGARSENAKEINSVLHIDTNNITYKIGINSLIRMLNVIDPSEVQLIHKIYAAENVEIDPHFMNFVKTTFESSVKNVDFKTYTNTSIKTNNWWADQTYHRITNVIESENMLVLVNVLVFTGIWGSTFEEKNTRLEHFHLNDTNSKKVPMMNQLFQTPYGVLSEIDATFVILEYEDFNDDDVMKMIIILPNKINGLDSIEKKIHKLQLADFNGKLHQVNVSLPKFRINSTINLEDMLTKLGMKIAFQEAADFSGILKINSGLKINKVNQHVMIHVDEECTGTAAIIKSTYSHRMKRSSPSLEKVSFYADHPFLILIANNNTVIFTGRVVDV